MDPMPHLENQDIDDIFAWMDAYTPAAAPAAGGEDNSTSLEEDTSLSSLWNWIRFFIFVIVVLLTNIAIQIARLRGVEFFKGVNLDKLNARLMLGFFVFGMIGAVWSTGLFKPYFLLNDSASAHGSEIDQLFWITMIVVVLVFVLTNGVLFWFAYRYGKDGDRKAKYYPENHKLELIWTVVPAIVLTVLIIFGIRTWTSVMSPPDDSQPIMRIEISGQQWGWIIRYPGDDEKFGEIDVRRIGGQNLLGVDMDDNATAGDFISQDLVLKKGMTVDLKIRSRDVLHSVYLPHFRVKMDAVPGMDTRFHFKPIYTTEEYRDLLAKGNSVWGGYDSIVSYQVDTTAGGDFVGDVEVARDTLWKSRDFDFELACTEICGRGHFSMRKKVVVLGEEEWNAWYAANKVKTILLSAGEDQRDEEFPQYAGQENTDDAGADDKNILE
ncbi:MAG: cytochrome c oxidase subunit II, partial [Bacteroidota bacterium]